MTATPTITPTPSPTDNPWATATWTYTWGFAPTSTPTPFGMPTATYTVTNTFTPTVTGTIEPTMTFTVTLTNTPSISRASLALLPTAYSNAWDRWDGFNWDIDFSYYIGAIAAKDNSSPNTDFLEPSRFAVLGTDVKYAWLDENGDVPAIANGLLLSLIAQLGSGNSNTGTSGSQSFQVSGNIMGGIYGVISKTIFPNTAVHFGYIQGLSKDAYKSMGLGVVSMNYSELLPLLTTKLQNMVGNPPPTSSTRASARVSGTGTGNSKFGNHFSAVKNPYCLIPKLTACPWPSTWVTSVGTRATPY